MRSAYGQILLLTWDLQLSFVLCCLLSPEKGQNLPAGVLFHVPLSELEVLFFYSACLFVADIKPWMSHTRGHEKASLSSSSSFSASAFVYPSASLLSSLLLVTLIQHLFLQQTTPSSCPRTTWMRRTSWATALPSSRMASCAAVALPSS